MYMREKVCKSCGQVVDDLLTIRVKEIVLLYLKGVKTPDIADMKCISTKTVGNYLIKACRQYEVKGVHELMAYCHQNGVIQQLEQELHEYEQRCKLSHKGA